MDDWQGCLAPQGQRALESAHRDVVERGGVAVTVEDFLLALLQVDESLRHFLLRHGIDLDELTRTIQSEQSAVPPVAETGGLSSQMVYWLSLTRDVSPSPWLTVADLMATLCLDADRLAGKAYVAILETIAGEGWRAFRRSTVEDEADVVPRLELPDWLRPYRFRDAFLVAVQAEWVEAAQDLLVEIAASGRAVHVLSGPPGSGRRALLRYAVRTAGRANAGALAGVRFWELDVLALWRQGPVQAALRQGLEIIDKVGSAVCLVVKGCDVAGLETLLDVETRALWRQLVAGARQGVVMVCDQEPYEESLWGLPLIPHPVEYPSVSQVMAVVQLHQSTLEREHQVVFAPKALEAAAWLSLPREARDYEGEHSPKSVKASPGEAIRLLKRAAARRQLLREAGPSEVLAARDRLQHLDRRFIVQGARGAEPVGDETRQREEATLVLAAEEVDWLEGEGREDALLVTRDHVVEEAIRMMGLPVIQSSPWRRAGEDRADEAGEEAADDGV